MSAITYDTIKVRGGSLLQAVELGNYPFPQSTWHGKNDGADTLCGCDGIYAEGR